MNLTEITIETQEVNVTQNEYNRRQIGLIAALLDIADILYQKESILLGNTIDDRKEVVMKEAA